MFGFSRRLIVTFVALMGFAIFAHSQTGFSPFDPTSLYAGTKNGQSKHFTTIALTDLPQEARDTLTHIKNGGPFPFAGDRSVFRNREHLLPAHVDSEYYRVYTVETPGDATSGKRRIVVGKGGERYYTEDRFKSFKLIKE